MVDNLKPEERNKTMRAVKGKGTHLEKRVFSMLAGMKIKGWKKNAKDIFGKPDIVFPIIKVAIFVDGCFWHGCPICNRKMPATNVGYWEKKIHRNIELAEIYRSILSRDGWIVIRVWEHELNNEEERKRIRTALKQTLGRKNND